MLYELDITPQSARNRLAAYQFTGEDVFKSVSVLSGGELSRLRLCMLMDEKINLLILDEPTNHLDIASREWVEAAIEEFEGVLLFVILWAYSARPRPVSAMSAVFLIGYGALRFVAEFFRTPDAGIFGHSEVISMGQWLSLPMVLAGVILLLRAGRRRN